MTHLEDWMRAHRSLRGGRRGRRRPKDPRRWVTTWRERELLDGEVVDALVAVLQTRGCSHERERGGCTMCGYAEDTPQRPPSVEELLAQVDQVARRREGARWVKLYTSGSMLDPEEVPGEVLGAIVAAFDDVDRLTVESRAEHVTEERVEAMGNPRRTEVAIGLESACDQVLEGSISKGMSFGEFERAAAQVKGAGAALRAYVLLKPPFLTEAEAIEDSVEATARAASAGATTVSINPVNVQGGTLVDFLHHRGEYEPPWLWSVLEVLRLADTALGSRTTRVISAPTAGGRTRGAHNCGRCDEAVLRAIEFNRLSGDPEELLRAPGCDCQERWKAQLELEGFLQGPFAPRGYRRSGR